MADKGEVFRAENRRRIEKGLTPLTHPPLNRVKTESETRFERIEEEGAPVMYRPLPRDGAEPKSYGARVWDALRRTLI